MLSRSNNIFTTPERKTTSSLRGKYSDKDEDDDKDDVEMDDNQIGYNTGQEESDANGDEDTDDKEIFLHSMEAMMEKKVITVY